MSAFSKLIYRFDVIPARYFGDTDKAITKFVWIDKRPRIANTVLKNKNKV